MIWGIENYDKRRGWRGVLHIFKESEIKKDWHYHLKKFSQHRLNKNKLLATVISISNSKIIIGLEDGQTGVLDLNKSSWIFSNLNDEKTYSVTNYVEKTINIGSVFLVRKNIYGEDSITYSLYQNPEVNGAIVVIDAFRQSGSAFKPFVYLAALENGMTPSTTILDSPLVIDQGPGLEEWIPKNYTGSYYGASTLRTGLEKSRNVMTVRLANTIGIEKIVEIAERFHLGSYPAQLATSLGAGETTLLNLTSAYASFINGGMLIKPKFIESIHDRNGKIVYRRDKRNCSVFLGFYKVL